MNLSRVSDVESVQRLHQFDAALGGSGMYAECLECAFFTCICLGFIRQNTAYGGGKLFFFTLPDAVFRIQQGDKVCKVSHIRAEYDRNFGCNGFHRVLSAFGKETLADNGDVRQSGPIAQFSRRVSHVAEVRRQLCRQ